MFGNKQYIFELTFWQGGNLTCEEWADFNKPLSYWVSSMWQNLNLFPFPNCKTKEPYICKLDGKYNTSIEHYWFYICPFWQPLQNVLSSNEKSRIFDFDIITWIFFFLDLSYIETSWRPRGIKFYMSHLYVLRIYVYSHQLILFIKIEIVLTFSDIREATKTINSFSALSSYILNVRNVVDDGEEGLTLVRCNNP